MARKKIYLIIIAEDASEKTKNKFLNLSKRYNAKVFIFGNIENNSKAIGKNNKAIIGISDENFALAICQIINGGDTIGQN